jgi:hypothetical protein
MRSGPDHLGRRRGRRVEDAEKVAHAQLDAGRWDERTARWYVLAQEAVTADARRAWAEAGAPRRRAREHTPFG